MLLVNQVHHHRLHQQTTALTKAECTWTQHSQDYEVQETFGLDTDAFTFALDSQGNFEMEDGGHLEDQELIIDHLIKCNGKLKGKGVLTCYNKYILSKMVVTERRRV